MVTTDIFYLVIHSPLSHLFRGCVFKFGIFEVGPKVPVTSYCSPTFWDYRHEPAYI